MTKAELLARIAEQDKAIAKRDQAIVMLRQQLSIAQRNEVAAAKRVPLRIYLAEFSSMKEMSEAASDLCAAHQIKSFRCERLATDRIAAFA